MIAGAGASGAVPGSFIVVLDPESTAGRVTSASQELVREYGGTVVEDYSATIRGFHLKATADQARRIAADPAVQYVEQDATISTAALQATKVTWGLDRIDQRALPLSRTYTYGPSSNVTAYVIDTGIRTSHQEFGGRATDGWDFVDDPTADDCPTDSTDERADFSNYGACVDLFAPGDGIPSAARNSDTASTTLSGTSMAAPHVAGAAVLALAAHPDWTPRQVRDDLVANAVGGVVRNPGAGSPDRLLYIGHLTGAA